MDLFNLMENKKNLIQDVGTKAELTRFFAHNIYRRDEPPKDNKVADFFAPYFTIPAEKEINVRGLCMYSLFCSSIREQRTKSKKIYLNTLIS